MNVKLYVFFLYTGTLVLIRESLRQQQIVLDLGWI